MSTLVMNTHTTTMGAAVTPAAQSNEVIETALSEWAKLMRQDLNLNCLQETDKWLAVELVHMFKKLAQHLPATALAVIHEECSGLRQSIKITKVMQSC